MWVVTQYQKSTLEQRLIEYLDGVDHPTLCGLRALHLWREIVRDRGRSREIAEDRGSREGIDGFHLGVGALAERALQLVPVLGKFGYWMAVGNARRFAGNCLGDVRTRCPRP